MKVRDSLSFKLGEFEEDMEIVDPESITVPDQAYSIKEILEKYSRGIDPFVERHGYYDSETPDFEALDPTLDPAFDLVDAQELYNEYQEAYARKKAEKENVVTEPEQDKKEQ